MGGAVVFPQLELGVNVPRGSLLHWHTRSAGGSSSDWDYRSGQAVCPVLLGIQLCKLWGVEWVEDEEVTWSVPGFNFTTSQHPCHRMSA